MPKKYAIAVKSFYLAQKSKRYRPYNFNNKHMSQFVCYWLLSV